MSTPEILLLGAIAGATIFLGLPVGRMQGLSPSTRAGLSALATGILVFLLWDVLSNAVDPMDSALHAHDWSRFAGLSALGTVGFTAGLMSLVYYDSWMKRRAGRRSSPLVGPGAAALDEFVERRQLDLTNPADPARVPDRDRHRRPQLRRGPRHRPGRGVERDQPRRDADHRLRAAQRDGGIRDLRAAERRGSRPQLAAHRAARRHRRSADIPRHGSRAGVDERRDLGPLLRGRRRLDPLRRPGALRRQPQVRPPGARHLARSSPGSCSASRRTSSSAPPASRAARARGFVAVSLPTCRL